MSVSVLQKESVSGLFAGIGVSQSKTMAANMDDMETRVVNVRVAHLRAMDPPVQNLREWMENPQNVYIGRGGVVFVPVDQSGTKVRWPPSDSVWANPFKVAKDDEASRAECVQKYRAHLKKQMDIGKITPEMLLSLRGKTLGCWCKPLACHGDVIVEMIRAFEK
jgi:hypothetical protein